MDIQTIDILLFVVTIFFGVLGLLLRRYMTKQEKKDGIGYSEKDILS